MVTIDPCKILELCDNGICSDIEKILNLPEDVREAIRGMAYWLLRCDNRLAKFVVPVVPTNVHNVMCYLRDTKKLAS